MPVHELIREEVVKRVYRRPMRFVDFLDAFGPKDFVELIDGSVVEKSMVQYDHERLLVWLITVLNWVVKKRELGEVLGSRTAVRIGEYRGRLPDFVFVCAERRSIIGRKAIEQAPDLIIELVSPNDRKSDINALETDYRSIGVNEIVFIDQQRREIRVLRKRERNYMDTTHRTGPIVLESLGGISLRVEWLFQDPLPNEQDTVDILMQS